MELDTTASLGAAALLSNAGPIWYLSTTEDPLPKTIRRLRIFFLAPVVLVLVPAVGASAQKLINRPFFFNVNVVDKIPPRAKRFSILMQTDTRTNNTNNAQPNIRFSARASSNRTDEFFPQVGAKPGLAPPEELVDPISNHKETTASPKSADPRHAYLLRRRSLHQGGDQHRSTDPLGLSCTTVSVWT